MRRLSSILHHYGLRLFTGQLPRELECLTHITMVNMSDNLLEGDAAKPFSVVVKLIGHSNKMLLLLVYQPKVFIIYCFVPYKIFVS